MWTGELAGYLHRTSEQAEGEDYPQLPGGQWRWADSVPSGWTNF